MDNIYGIEWERIKNQFDLWWQQKNEHRPLINIKAPKVKGMGATGGDRWVESSSGTGSHSAATEDRADYTNYWTKFEELTQRNEGIYANTTFLAETYPRLFASLGVTSHAVFLGGKPEFQKETIWCDHIYDEPEDITLKLDPNNEWYRWSLDMTRRIKEHAGDAYRIGIPDLCEHYDVLASLFATQDLLFHMMDYEDEIKELARQTQQHWYTTYNAHYDIVKEPDGYVNYGPFGIFGKGKIAKLQCDMSAMIGKDMFDDFVLPLLKEQTEYLDNCVYHLDGPDAIKHLDSVLTMPKLSALQWTPGAGNKDGGDEEWDFIYEKALNAGKSIYALVGPQNIKRFVKKFGYKGVFIITSAEDTEHAKEILSSVKCN